ncbi:uncharacterized protein LOC120707975 isoform X2 [Panicum virgatum]|uniref:uncharacterized protein LOC120707975 isoform X2 n=1 Tax=Panicum virgatum TaxID=38727 RepID=UPI0019D57406|nr:uncharacterized protein LOC120707975 isoform X2 [Panicum virgatum]
MVNLGGGKGSGGDSRPWKQRWPGEWRPWRRGGVTVDLQQLGHYLPFSSQRSPWGAAEPELPSRSVVDLIHPVAASRLAMISRGSKKMVQIETTDENMRLRCCVMQVLDLACHSSC